MDEYEQPPPGAHSHPVRCHCQQLTPFDSPRFCSLNTGTGKEEPDHRLLSERIGDKVRADLPRFARSCPCRSELTRPILLQNWKTRQTAYEDLKKSLKLTLGDDPLFDEYGVHVSEEVPH